jgi:hypothetical protein
VSIAAVAALLALPTSSCSDDAKKGVGESCANNTDCADAICHSGICVSRSPLTNGAPCQGNAFCRSLKCSGGTCAQNDRADGTACLNAEECASRACTAGICLGATPPDGGRPDASVDWDGAPIPDRGTVVDHGTVVDQYLQPEQFLWPDLPVADGASAGLFGALCTSSCGLTLTCIKPGTGSGFCTKTCSQPGQPCSGAPAGTGAFCVMQVGSTYYCGFLCKTSTQSWNCPTQLKCDTTDNPPGSGNYYCLP